MISFGVDIGGSGIKGAPVDLSNGQLTGVRYRVPTPEPATPDATIEAVREVVEHHGWDQPLGVTVPGVVVGGVVLTAANIDSAWIGLDAQTRITDRLGLPVAILNDADAAGIAEVRFGHHDASHGVVLLLTFGTGIGSALFNNGILVPNTEFGHLEFKGGMAEEYAAGRLVKRGNIEMEWWAERVNEFLKHMDLIVSPRVVIIGGGISKRFDEFRGRLNTRAVIVPATLRNNAGIVGAAMVAAPRELT
jgi:polyphosphate glucokinase